MSDPSHVSQLLLRHRHSLLAFIHGLVADPHASEDLFQEVSLVVVQKASEFEEGTNFPAWARSILRNKIREHLRRRQGVLIDEALLDELDRDFRAVEEGLDPDGRREALRRCLGTLADRVRQAIVLRYDEGLSMGEIAARVGQTPAAVNSLLQRAREALRDCVERGLAAGEA
jgi:RNA polymerase sigma-70 factor (ECF subfamily)